MKASFRIISHRICTAGTDDTLLKKAIHIFNMHYITLTGKHLVKILTI